MLIGAIEAMSFVDPFSADSRSEAIAPTGRTLLSSLVAALPRQPGSSASPSSASASPFAHQLWPKLTPRRRTAKNVKALNSVLIIMADHELAGSTFAARIAASFHAGPYDSLCAALAVARGSLHAGATERATTMLSEVVEHGNAESVVAQFLERGERIPGLGHHLYRSGDPRFFAIRDLCERSGLNPVPFEAVDELEAVCHSRDLPRPNVDMGLAAFALSNGMRPNMAALIFVIARMAGWLAHISEEYTQRSSLRPRGVYIGTPIGE